MLDDAPVLPAIVASPLAERMQTFIRHLRSRGFDLSDKERAATWSNTFPGFALLPKSLARWSDLLAEFTIDGYEQADSFAGAGLLTGADGRAWRACVVVDDEAPHLILASALFSAPPGVEARGAIAADAADMREVERRTPVVDASSSTFYDRGEDYLAGERLMGDDVEMFVVEREGRIVGVGGRAFPMVRVAGELYRGLYSHRLRLLPEAQGEGVLGPLNAVRMLSGAARHCLSYAFVAAGNEAAIRSMPGGPEREGFWAERPVRLIIDTATAAPAPPAGRRAGPADAARLVELFNVAHQDEELFVPYTLTSLAARLEREPTQYSWGSILLADGAALGIWPARLGVHRESGATVTDDVRALALDYGCENGSEDDLVGLIRSACGSLAAEGITELSLFSSPPARSFVALRSLAKRTEPYSVSCWRTPGPNIEHRGVYVDQLYF
jgi:hypothetical protein